MLSNKDIVNAYKKSKPIKRVFRPSKWEFEPVVLIMLGMASVLPTLALGLYLKQSMLQLVLRLVIAFISFVGVLLTVATPFMGAKVCSNPASSSRAESVVLAASFIGYIPQILYAFYVLKY